MNAEIICVGTELVLGDTLNTNAQYLSQQLALKGIDVYFQTAVGDNPARIVSVLSAALSRSSLIIFTGGLGPTADDITVETVADALDIPLSLDDEAYKRIREHFATLGRRMPQDNEKQALVPAGSVVFQNERGTAPGCAIESGDRCIIFLPGPPSEMSAMFETSVLPHLEKYSSGTIKSKFINLYGIGEAEIDEKVKDLSKRSNPTVAPYAKEGQTKLRISAKAESERAALAMIQNIIPEIKSRFGEKIYGFDNDSLQSVVVDLLRQKGLTVATAESCTAGYISKKITEVPGSSAVFTMGVTTYSNQSKTDLLCVPAEIIEQNGAVSESVAAFMAKGVRLKSGADIGLSITGVAGPGSPQSDKPVGLSYIAISDKNGEYVLKCQKGGKRDREFIRNSSSLQSLDFLRLYLLGEEPESEF